MRHLAYPKIPVVERSGTAAGGGQWVATEKVHGAQMVIACDGREVSVGKRKAWLRDEEPFFGWQLLRAAFEKAAQAALARGGTAVRVYGELYGGGYPHPEVPPVPGAAPVQTGVWYSPQIRFALFEVLRQEDPDDPGVFLPYSDVAQIAADAGLDAVPLLARGGRTDLDALPVRFPTRVPQSLGLPALAGNLAEGLVLRPDAPLTPSRRPVLKRKIEEFDEQRFDQSRPWDPQAFLTFEELSEIACAMVNGPRLASARSKVGPSPLDALLDEVVLDVMVDLSLAFPAATAALGATEARLQEVVRIAAAAQTRGRPA
ncbi:RNA ligase [Planomonospora sphaerica]|uniref:RNA ligase n=1 Tax=Planomonospora sphaerica TaxID=161355 RepID=A0A171DQN0_9ACTN|nr:RNA ligase family protein [Planomonospora sphaerica]GAT71371.1 RNA ligase [Planomonospora sphaerica]